MLQEEVPWLDQLKQMPKVRIDSHGFPESFALTETDREYFNIIKTEDGTSDFIRYVMFQSRYCQIRSGISL